MKKRLLITSSTFPRWTKDTEPPFVFELGKRLVKNFDVFILAPHFQGAKKFEKLENLKIHRFQYFWPEKWQKLCYRGGILPNLKNNKLLILQAPFLIISEFLAVRKIVKKERINLIHAHWIIPQGLIAVLYKKLFREKDLKIICTTHGGDIFGLQSRLMKRIKQWTLNNVDRLTVVSHAIKGEVKKLGIRKTLSIKVVPMGVDYRVFNQNCYDEKVKEKHNIRGSFLLFVGRLVEKKGVKYLIEAMPRVVRKYPQTKLLIVGSGPLKKSLENQTKRLNLANNVLFVGGIENNKLPKYYATADIFIGPSVKTKDGDTEGFGVVFVEALLSKTCVISSDLKSISDIVKNEKTGVQIDVKNSDLLAEKIIELIGSREKRERLAKNGHDFVKKNYSWNVIANKYRKVLEKLV